MYLTDLAVAARKSGLKVVEVAGWRSRGHGPMAAARTIVPHHTAGPALGNYPSLAVVRDGRPGLAGPLAHLGLGRDGTVYVIAAGLCYHAGAVRDRDQGNAYAIGIEAEHTGTGPWPPEQYAAYVRLCAALCAHYRLPVARVQGHKEVCSPKGRKVDPNFDMPVFRNRITTLAATPPAKYSSIAKAIRALRVARDYAKKKGDTADQRTLNADITRLKARYRRLRKGVQR